MRRMTIRGDHGVFLVPGHDFEINPEHYDAVQQVLSRLAEYEDSGLAPGEVRDMTENAESALLTWFQATFGFPAGQLMAFCDAAREGRLEVHPREGTEKGAESDG